MLNLKIHWARHIPNRYSKQKAETKREFETKKKQQINNAQAESSDCTEYKHTSNANLMDSNSSNKRNSSNNNNTATMTATPTLV